MLRSKFYIINERSFIVVCKLNKPDSISIVKTYNINEKNLVKECKLHHGLTFYYFNEITLCILKTNFEILLFPRAPLHIVSLHTHVAVTLNVKFFSPTYKHCINICMYLFAIITYCIRNNGTLLNSYT